MGGGACVEQAATMNVIATSSNGFMAGPLLFPCTSILVKVLSSRQQVGNNCADGKITGHRRRMGRYPVVASGRDACRPVGVSGSGVEQRTAEGDALAVGGKFEALTRLPVFTPVRVVTMAVLFLPGRRR